MSRSAPKGKGMTLPYRRSVTNTKSPAETPVEIFRKIKKRRRETKHKQAQESMSRPASEWPDVGGSQLFGSGHGYGMDVNKFLGAKELRALSAISLGARKGASKVITERNYRYVQIKDENDKNMNGKTGLLIENDTEKYPNLFKYIITLIEPVGNMFVYYAEDESKFTDVPTSTEDSALTTRINKEAMEKALRRQEEMCSHHDKKTCLQKVLGFFGISKFKSHKKSVKKSVKKSHKKSVKKSNKKNAKKSVKKSLKKSHKKSLKKSHKKSLKKSHKKSHKKSNKKNAKK
jgi:hypothetical protein